MEVKLIMQWDIKEGMDQEYFDFIVRKWIPASNDLGLETIGAWYTVYSRTKVPQIRVEIRSEDLKSLKDKLNSAEWKDLLSKLDEFIENYSHKIVPMSGNFQF